MVGILHSPDNSCNNSSLPSFFKKFTCILEFNSESFIKNGIVVAESLQKVSVITNIFIFDFIFFISSTPCETNLPCLYNSSINNISSSLAVLIYSSYDIHLSKLTIFPPELFTYSYFISYY